MTVAAGRLHRPRTKQTYRSNKSDWWPHFFSASPPLPLPPPHHFQPPSFDPSRPTTRPASCASRRRSRASWIRRARHRTSSATPGDWPRRLGRGVSRCPGFGASIGSGHAGKGQEPLGVRPMTCLSGDARNFQADWTSAATRDVYCYLG